MKFLVDAQLPRRFVIWLTEAGHDALHTLDLPDRNRTIDAEIVARAVREDRVVVSKDCDFMEHYLLTGKPLLLLTSTGNISHAELEQLLQNNLVAIATAFVEYHWVEMTRDTLIIHE